MEKGQIFSMDFIISMVAVVAATGLLIQAVEVGVYNAKEAGARKELEVIAERAADMIAAGYIYQGNKGTTCYDSASGLYLMNCIDSGINSAQVTHILIPYNYEVTDDSGALHDLSRGSGTLGDNDFYEAVRTVFVNNAGGGTEELRVKVWRT